MIVPCAWSWTRESRQQSLLLSNNEHWQVVSDLSCALCLLPGWWLPGCGEVRQKRHGELLLEWDPVSWRKKLSSYMYSQVQLIAKIVIKCNSVHAWQTKQQIFIEAAWLSGFMQWPWNQEATCLKDTLWPLKLESILQGRLKVIPLKLFYYQTFFQTWRD